MWVRMRQTGPGTIDQSIRIAPWCGAGTPSSSSLAKGAGLLNGSGTDMARPDSLRQKQQAGSLKAARAGPACLPAKPVLVCRPARSSAAHTQDRGLGRFDQRRCRVVGYALLVARAFNNARGLPSSLIDCFDKPSAGSSVAQRNLKCKRWPCQGGALACPPHGIVHRSIDRRPRVHRTGSDHWCDRSNATNTDPSSSQPRPNAHIYK